ncbi:MAG: ATP synthase F1 subunit delta [Polyangiaceae bacterium]|nr:ATP synthase F1 subunit delta [Polyangiaceae bacterium]
MSAGAVQERYAQALLGFAEESGDVAGYAAKLESFAQAVRDSKELKDVLTSPLFSQADRFQVIGALGQKLGLAPHAINGLKLISQRGRISFLSAIARRLGELADEKAGILRARVITATKMPESYYMTIKSGIQQATGKKVELDRAEDDSLIGGAIAVVGGVTIDASIQGRLDSIEKSLLSALGDAS